MLLVQNNSYEVKTMCLQWIFKTEEHIDRSRPLTLLIFFFMENFDRFIQFFFFTENFNHFIKFCFFTENFDRFITFFFCLDSNQIAMG